MIEFNLEREIDDPEYPGLRVAAEFGAVEQYLKMLSEYLPVVRDQTRVRFEAQQKRKFPKLSRSDLPEVYEEIDWVTETLVPMFFSLMKPG